MEEVFDQYGGYIVAVIGCAIVIFAVTCIIGLNEDLNNTVSGTGIFGKLICLWLNRIM